MKEVAANPWLQRAVFHWAHQGGAREGPSNTLYAMEQALSAGAHGLEFDVHRTADGHLVLAHDKRLERTTNGTGQIAQRRLAELRGLDAAYWWVPGSVEDHDAPEEAYTLRGRAPEDRDLTIPTLDECLARFRVPLTIEIKAKEAVEDVVALLRARAVPRDDVIVTSFLDGAVRRLRRAAPDLLLAPGSLWTAWFLLRVRLGRPPRSSPYAAIQVPHRYHWADNLARRWRRFARLIPPRLRAIIVIDERFVAAARRTGMAVHAWTIDDKEEMRDLIAMGVHGIMTDRPSVLDAVLRDERGSGEARDEP